MTISMKRLFAAGAAAVLIATGAGAVLAEGERPGIRAASYINPDLGMATYNPDVDPASNCFQPDQLDKQRFSDAGSVAANVHNDACFLDSSGNKVDGPATFESHGAGVISACPDPDDAAGPRVARLTDSNGDGRMDRCFQSGYQLRNIAGDREFHARLNSAGMAGRQTVVWCSDADMDGCADEATSSTIVIDWSSNGQGTFFDYPNQMMDDSTHAHH